MMRGIWNQITIADRGFGPFLRGGSHIRDGSEFAVAVARAAGKCWNCREPTAALFSIKRPQNNLISLGIEGGAFRCRKCGPIVHLDFPSESPLPS